jgi:hypothetical protein
MNEFNLSLSKVLAHSQVFFSGAEHGNIEAYNGGGPDYPDTGESMDSMMQAMTKHFGPYSEQVRQQILPNELAKLEASRQITPEYASYIADTLNKYGPGVNQANLDLNKQTRMGEAAIDTELIKGAGKDSAMAAQEIDKLLSPEMYKTRESTGAGIEALLASLNPDNIGAESDRALARMGVATGTQGMPSSASKTLAGGMMYGNEKMKRLSALDGALKTAMSFLPTAQSNFNPVSIALQRPSGNYTDRINTQQNPGQESFQAGSNMFNQMSAIQQGHNAAVATKKDGWDKFGQAMSGVGDLLGGISSGMSI